MTEDPSAGYIVKGYYADAEIAKAPDGLKKIGSLKDLNGILSSTINDTINGAPSNIDEVFCCLSHKDSERIVKIMQFCDKNVIHFYYLHVSLVSINYIWMPRISWVEQYIPITRSR